MQHRLARLFPPPRSRAADVWIELALPYFRCNRQHGGPELPAPPVWSHYDRITRSFFAFRALVKVTAPLSIQNIVRVQCRSRRAQTRATQVCFRLLSRVNVASCAAWHISMRGGSLSPLLALTQAIMHTETEEYSPGSRSISGHRPPTFPHARRCWRSLFNSCAGTGWRDLPSPCFADSLLLASIHRCPADLDSHVYNAWLVQLTERGHLLDSGRQQLGPTFLFDIS